MTCLAQDERLCRKREGRGEVPLSFSRGNGANEAEEAHALRLAIWFRFVSRGHQRVCRLGPFVPKMLPYRDRAEGEW